MDERLTELHWIREDWSVITFYKAIGVKSPLRLGLSKKKRLYYFVFSTSRSFNTCLPKENSYKKTNTFCLLLIALSGYFSETLSLSTSSHCKFFHWSKERYQLTTLLIGVTVLAFHLPNEILQLAVKIAGS